MASLLPWLVFLMLIRFLVATIVCLLSYHVRASETELGVRGHQFTINGEPKFLIGVSYYGALGSTEERMLADLEDIQRYGFNWIRVWATWNAFEQNISVVDFDGIARPEYLKRLKWLVEQCDRRGIVVDVTLARGRVDSGDSITTFAAHQRCLETIVTALAPFGNWYLDLANERNVRDARFVSFEELRILRERVRDLDSQLLVTASDGGDISKEDLERYLLIARVDFITPHRGRYRGVAVETERKSHEYFNWMEELGHVVPLHYQEPFRRGYAPLDWEPEGADFAQDLKKSIAGGAAGWCFHNGDHKGQSDGCPRRSFDLSRQRLFEQLDSEELRFLRDVQRICGRLRVIIETDAGGDPDDEQSLVRFLLYCNEWDVEGIICNRAVARDGENRNKVRTGLGIIQQQLSAYGECYSKLSQHDSLYPTQEDLWARTVRGYADSEDGVHLIMGAVDKRDSRPIWFMNWGTDHGSAPSSLKRALDRVLHSRGDAGYKEFKERLLISGDDRFGEHTTTLMPSFRLWVNTKEPEWEGRRWYRRFGPLTAKAGGFDLQRDVLENHGPLGSLYPTNTNIAQKEGDTTQFLYLVPTGMNDPLQPKWGSWAGRYGRNQNYVDREVYWANQEDHWNGSTHRENSLARWAEDLQNDFRVRMDWCVADFDDANHPPQVVLNGRYGGEIWRVSAAVGEVVVLDANGTIDVDGDKLRYSWGYYREAGEYLGNVALEDAASVRTELTIPKDARGKQLHILLSVQDDGEPRLTRYRRAVIDVEGS